MQLVFYIFIYSLKSKRKDRITNLIILVQSNSPPIPTSIIATSIFENNWNLLRKKFYSSKPFHEQIHRTSLLLEMQNKMAFELDPKKMEKSSK